MERFRELVRRIIWPLVPKALATATVYAAIVGVVTLLTTGMTQIFSLLLLLIAFVSLSATLLAAPLTGRRK